ncbi:MAG: hypothetical protein ABTS22_18585 [Accumulibacter sp.]|uniref:hypothetical protein n=1 Tax=Accumulibacter sp. TaxID=2053492 RepID=UPI0033158238
MSGKIIEFRPKTPLRIQVLGDEYEITDDLYFGGCPVCKKSGYFLNVERDHWCVCDEHKTCWSIGSNLFSNWMNEDWATWQRNNAKLLTCTVVDPWYPENR